MKSLNGYNQYGTYQEIIKTSGGFQAAEFPVAIVAGQAVISTPLNIETDYVQTILGVVTVEELSYLEPGFQNESNINKIRNIE